MTLTPRQIGAYLGFNKVLDDLARAADLKITAVGTQGDKDAIDRTLKELTGLWR